MNFERGITDAKQSIGVGRKAMAYHITDIREISENNRLLVSVKLNRIPEILKNLSENSYYYIKYDYDIYFVLNSPTNCEEFPNSDSHPAWLQMGLVFPKDLAGKDVVWKDNLYSFISWTPDPSNPETYNLG